VTIVTSIFVMDPSASGALTLSNGGVINIPGLVMVDSTSASALNASGTSKITAASIQVAGKVLKTGTATFSVTPVTGATALPDPMASLAVPSGGTNQVSINIGDSTSKTINPGIYSSITVSGSAVLTLNPGVYVIAGGNLTVQNLATLTGSGVLIYMTGANYPNSGGSFGSILINNGATVTLSAAATGTYAGVAIFQDRANAIAITLNGTSVVNLQGGLLYAVKAKLTIASSAVLKHAAIVVKQLNISGTSASTDIKTASSQVATASAAATVSANAQPALALTAGTSVPQTTPASNPTPAGSASSMVQARNAAPTIQIAVVAAAAPGAGAATNDAQASWADDGFVLHLGALDTRLPGSRTST
jgi:hypothetical protein